MVYSASNEEWVAFAEDDDMGNNGFEAVVRPTEQIRVAPNRLDSPRKHRSDMSTSSSWMKKPISTDSSWAPVAPPETRDPVPGYKNRPPRNPVSSPRNKSASTPHLVSSSDSSSDGRPSRERTAAAPTSRRGRSSSRSRQQPTARQLSRTRSSSRTRGTSKSRGRSTSVQRKSGSSGGLPPQTRHRSRSTSRSRPVQTTIVPRTMNRANSSRPPPSTSRTRGLIRANVSGSASVGPGMPRNSPASPSNASQTSFFDDNASFKSFDVNIGRDISFGRTKSSQSVTTTTRNTPATSSSTLALDHMHSRILLTATVYHNTATNLWIATINTNQKGVSKNPSTASKYLKAFSFSSEKEARESAIANAPPKMLPFSDNPSCSMCNKKFTMFRRASHCRNCGVCVCNSCSVMWQSKMLPETYNLKKEAYVKICRNCNYLSGAFKKALLSGDYEQSIALYGSGNVNLRVPFPVVSKKKDEVMYPIHCAVQGGNIDVIQWLIEDHHCPIKKVVRSGKKKGGKSEVLIRSSKDRTVLSIALSTLNVDVIRYLVVDCGVSIYEAKDLKSALRALETVLLALPTSEGHRDDIVQNDMAAHRWDNTSFNGEMSVASSLGADLSRADDATLGSKRRGEACILCYENSIDCVMTPCGHQVCCLKCSASLTTCPVCNIKGNFIKIFRP